MTDAEKLSDAIASLNALLERLAPPTELLVVEDSEDDWFFLKRALEQFRCRVTRARDGEEAVRLIRSTKFDVILLDQSLPKLTGNEVLQETVGFRSNSKVILVTGLPGAPQISDALDRGAIIALPKPVTEIALTLFLKRYGA